MTRLPGAFKRPLSRPPRALAFLGVLPPALMVGPRTLRKRVETSGKKHSLQMSCEIARYEDPAIILLAINGVADNDVPCAFFALDTGLGFIKLGALYNHETQHWNSYTAHTLHKSILLSFGVSTGRRHGGLEEIPA